MNLDGPGSALAPVVLRVCYTSKVVEGGKKLLAAVPTLTVEEENIQKAPLVTTCRRCGGEGVEDGFGRRQTITR